MRQVTVLSKHFCHLVFTRCVLSCMKTLVAKVQTNLHCQTMQEGRAKCPLQDLCQDHSNDFIFKKFII